MILGHRYPEPWPLRVKAALRLRTCTKYGHRNGQQCSRCTLMRWENPEGLSAIGVITLEEIMPAVTEYVMQRNVLLDWLRR